MRRYVVFYMSNYLAYDVREVTPEDTVNTVMVPIDTRFFFFVQSEYSLEEVKSTMYRIGAFCIHPEAYILCNCEIENDTLYLIGKRVKDTVINAWAETMTPWSLINKWGGQIEIIDSDKLVLQTRKSDYKGNRKEFWGYSDKKTYIVTLESDGIVSSISWAEDGTDRIVNHLFQQLNGLMCDIKVVAGDHPEIYQEILARLDEKEHEYFKKLADFCRKESNRM